MKALYDLRETLCDELEEIARKPDMSAGDLETVHKLTDTIKNIDKICVLESDGEYSQAGDWEAQMRGNYGHSYARGGRGGRRGGYSRDGNQGSGQGYSQRRYSRSGYSRDGIMEQLGELMEDASTDKEREAIRRCMETMRG